MALNPYAEPYLGRQYYLNHIGDIFGAWKKYTGKGITIAVIDKGFDVDHPEFQYADGTSKVSTDSASFTTNDYGQTSVAVGRDKAKNMDESHGTFCAGVAAAAANGKGTIGIAPDAELLLLKTDGKPKSIAKAFYYAADHGAKVVTISIGHYYNYGRDVGKFGDLVDDGSDLGTVFDAPVLYCVNHGIPVISAAGNGGLDDIPTEFTFPGCVDNVIGAGGLAANSSNRIWGGSSYNSSPEWPFVDVVAPADGMFGPCNYGSKYDGGWVGTSFASPIVAGMAALYFEAHPDKTVAEFTKALYDSCDHFTPVGGVPAANQIGAGRVDVGALLGIPSSKYVVNCETSWSSCNAYYWNSKTGEEFASWPGVPMPKKNGVYSLEIPAKYDMVIFNSQSSQSADLLVSSFGENVTYTLKNGVTENGYILGSYKR